ncbi:MAG: hypothetical protein JXR86_17620 [Spirochaetales bacterium]|nr:hypothetical protein [Spirochaetales bacterium]
MKKNNSMLLLLRRQSAEDVLVTKIPPQVDDSWEFSGESEGFSISVLLKKEELYTSFKITGSHPEGENGHFVLQAETSGRELWNFDGPVTSDEIYRQSPHDVDAWISDDIAKQAVPLIAFGEDSLWGAVSSSPAFYDNYTSQGYFPSKGFLELSSGDSGQTPGKKPNSLLLEKEYNLSAGQKLSTGVIEAFDHPMKPDDPHMFEGFIFDFSLQGENLEQKRNYFRQQINRRIAVRFCNSSGESLFGDLSSATAYMNLRRNETGNSEFWVIPAVEYSNVQYGRDAFWISMMLDPRWDASCLENDLVKADTYSEYCLFDLIWAYRNWKNGQQVNMENVKRCLSVVESKVRDSWFYAYDESDGRQDFQFWGDIMAFEKDDVVSYNQGLLSAALAMAEKMSLHLPENMNPGKAADNYRALFNEDLSFFPMSRQKNTLLTVDALVGDVLSQAYLEEPLLPDSLVEKHYRAMVEKSKTPWGFKTVCMPDGSYLPHELYNAGDYIAQINREENMPDGTYYRGGSYLLYDGVMLIDACLHKIPGADEELIKRIRLEFEMGGTTYECLNTTTGEPWKPNMGWNGGIYALLKLFIDEGKINPEIITRLDH